MTRRAQQLIVVGLIVIGVAVAGPTPPARAAERPPREGPPPPEAMVEQPAPTSDAGAGWRWVPRVLLFPLYATVEYGLRRPSMAALAWAERTHAIEKLQSVFVHMGGRLIVYPTFYYEFGLRPSAGFSFSYLPWNGVSDGRRTVSRLDVGGAFWTQDWTKIYVRQRFGWPSDGISAGDRLSTQLSLRASYESRPDRVFYGIGADSRRSSGRFFRQRRSELALAGSTWQAHMVQLGLSTSFVTASFGEGLFPSINDQKALETLPGFGGYSLVGARAELVLDTRYPFRQRLRGQGHGSGLRLEAFGRYDVAASDRQIQFVRYGGELALFLDVSGSGHVLSVRGRTEMLTSIGSALVPFSELPLLGGNETMPAFFEGRFRGASTLDLTAQYRYPVWTFLDAVFFTGVGNAFDSYLRDASLARTHLSFGFGVRTTPRRDFSIDFLLAAGTNRLDSSDVSIEQVRFVVGVNHGF